MAKNHSSKLASQKSSAAIIGISIVLILGLLALAIIFSSRDEHIYSIEELGEYVTSHPLSGNEATVAECFEYWNFPEFDKEELLRVEYCFNYYYYTSLPPVKDLAETAAAVFLDLTFDIVSDPHSKTEITQAVIDAYIYAVGDDYAYYRSPEAQEEFDSDMSGHFVGIGIEILKKPGEYLINGVISGSPAEAAGILPGDLLVGADGLRVDTDGYDAVVSSISGEVGTSVNVVVSRNGAELSFDIVRAEIQEQTVVYDMLDEELGYIKISSFKTNTAYQFAKAIDAIEASGAKGVIFDLRNNPGGSLSAVVNAISYLVPSGTQIVSFSNGRLPLYAAHGTSVEPEDHVLKIPAVYICNGYTASAAELFCASVRDYNTSGLLRSCGVGQKSFGKGIMQTPFTFVSGSTLTLTSALYNPPSGVNYHGVGITPDVLPSDPELYLEVAIRELERLVSGQDSAGGLV